MLQLGCSHPGFSFQTTEASDRYESGGMPVAPNGPCSVISTNSPPTPTYPSTSARADTHNAVVHWKQGGQAFTNDSRSDEDVYTSDTDFRPFTPPPPRERLSYTRYQLELLNGIYKHVKYPTSTQKLLVAKRVGITRDQVKIWFQNRRRKDVLAKQGQKGEDDRTVKNEDGSEEPKPEDNDENKAESMVPNLVMDSIVSELIKFKNEHLKSKKQKGKKKSTTQAKQKRVEEAGSDITTRNNRPVGLFSGYEMVNPPNQVTPSAFSNKPFAGIGNRKLSAFDKPCDKLEHPYSRPYYRNDSSPSSLSANNQDITASQQEWSNYLHTPNDPNADANYASRQGRPLNVFDSSQQKSNLIGHFGTNQQQEVSHEASRSYPMTAHGYNMDTIPVLSDLLGNSSKQSSCDVRPSDTWCSYGQDFTSRERNENLSMGFPMATAHTPVTMEAFISTRTYAYPAALDSSNMSVIRNSEPCRPQPHYPSSSAEPCRPQPYHPPSFTHREPFHSFPLSAYSSSYHTQYQPPPSIPQWLDVSNQDNSYLQL